MSKKHIDGRTVALCLYLQRRWAEPSELAIIEKLVANLTDALAARHSWTEAQKQDWLLVCECGVPGS